jgi:hypothetical protein
MTTGDERIHPEFLHGQQAAWSEDYCDRCGAFAQGRRQWMFYHDGVAREFFCARCLKIMRVCAAVGLTLLVLLVAAAVAAVWFLRLRAGRL